jgi:hypothetical protein
MEPNPTGVRLSRSLDLQFSNGLSLSVDLRTVEMSEEQERVVAKLQRELLNLDEATCRGEKCPAQAVLSDDEFEMVRSLRKTIGLSSAGEAAGPLIDFCLHVINV